jgi:hypothetical protein
MWQAREMREKYREFWWENHNEREHSEDLDLDGRMGSEWILGRLVGRVE